MALATSAAVGFGKGGELAGSWSPGLGRRGRIGAEKGGLRGLVGVEGGWERSGGGWVTWLGGCREGWDGGLGGSGE